MFETPKFEIQILTYGPEKEMNWTTIAVTYQKEAAQEYRRVWLGAWYSVGEELENGIIRRVRILQNGKEIDGAWFSVKEKRSDA